MGKNTTFWFRTYLRISKFYPIILVFLLTGLFPVQSHGQNDRQSILWGEIYGSSETNSDEDYNIVNEVFIKQGLHFFKIWNKNIDVYLKAKLVHDTEPYYWNNRGELSIGTRIKPFSTFGLILFMEYLKGFYTDREESDYPNPDDSSFYEWEGGYAFWQWWGAQPWQVKGINLYAPFTGWREVYSDGIYHEHDEHNVIATLDYKEGLMLARLGSMKLDAYTTIEVSVDKNKDEWNNYIRIGPGFRITPFAKINLKLSFEYFIGRYTHGGFNETDEDISNFVITLAFWHGW